MLEAFSFRQIAADPIDRRRRDVPETNPQNDGFGVGSYTSTQPCQLPTAQRLVIAAAAGGGLGQGLLLWAVPVPLVRLVAEISTMRTSQATTITPMRFNINDQ